MRRRTREGLRAALEDRYDVYLAEDAKAAMDLLEKEHFDVLLTDFRLPSRRRHEADRARQVALQAAHLHPDDRLRLGGTGGRGDETRRGRLHRQGPLAD